MEWMILPFKRYFEFTGRSRRMEFWMFMLFSLIVGIVAGIIDYVLGFGSRETVVTGASYMTRYTTSGPVAGIKALVFLIPSIAVAVRRLHDTNRTGWWLLLPFPFVIVVVVTMFSAAFSAYSGNNASMVGNVAVLGIAGLLTFVSFIVLLVFYCLDGTAGTNRFGPDPKNPNADVDAEKVFG